MLVFVPLSAADLRAWAGGARAARGYATTPSFLIAFGLAPSDDEDAERTLLHVAALDALLTHGARLVAVMDAPARDLGGDLGAVAVGPTPFGRVTALFADHPDAAGAVAGAASALAGTDLDAAWEHPAHEALMEATDLLWFGPEEWSRLVS